jgi:hypothetical protein
MRKILTLSEKITLSFFLISIFAFIYSLTLYIRIDIRTINFEVINTIISREQIYAAISIILIFIFHLSAILTIILKLRAVNRESIFLSFIFFTSIISLIMIFGDFALMSDIVKEYKAGVPGIESEFAILYFSQFLHLLFYCLIIAIIILDNRIKKISVQPDAELPLKDEAIFINTQYIGIFTSVFGLAILITLSASAPLWAIKKGIVAMCALLIIPYAAIAIYWLVIKIRERVTEWYDEKQFQDVTKAGLVSFLSSIIILTIFFVLQNAFKKFLLLNVIWFPLYFFIALLIFSGTILYSSKKAS